MSAPEVHADEAATYGQPTRRMWYWFRHSPLLWSSANRLFLWKLKRNQARLIRRLGSANQVVRAWGVTVPVDLRDISDFLFFTWDRGPGVVEAATQAIGRGDVCLDVGANRGYLTVLFSLLSGPTGRVHAFEPGARSLAKFRSTLDANRYSEGQQAPIELHTVAAWDGTEKVPLYASLVDSGRDSTQSHGTSMCTEVEARRIDDVLAREGPVNFVKMDIEGAELRAMRGMEGVLDRSPNLTLVIEWNHIYATRPLWDLLSSRFDIYLLTSQGPLPLRGPEGLRGVHNLLCRKH